jgi:hypothetical protein
MASIASTSNFKYSKHISIIFFRPTPYGSRQVVNQAGKPMQIGKFSELMQWQHSHIDNVHQKQN